MLLDDAFLKCVVTEIVLFSIVAFKTLTFHKRHTSGVVGSLVTVLLQMFSWFWQWNKFENRSIFYEVKEYKTKCASFLGPPCIYRYQILEMTSHPRWCWVISKENMYFATHCDAIIFI